MAEIADIRRALTKVDAVSEWVISSRTETTRWVRLGPSKQTGELQQALTRVVVYRDRAAGRGSASFVVDAGDGGDLDALVRDAVARAGTGAGPAWSLPDPAAPARVQIADAWLAEHLEAAAQSIARSMSDNLPGGHVISGGSVATTREQIAVTTSSGFSSEYVGTEASAVANVAAGDSKPGEVERVARFARRIQDLDLDQHVPAAAERLRDHRAAEPTPPGRYELLLTGGAITCEAITGDRDEHFAWFSPFVAQAGGASARQGLSRYQVGQSVFGDVEVTGDPLSLASDGTLDYAVRSAPFGHSGEPVRRFELVRDGIAAGLSLDLREAGLRKVTANGGVRNLVVGSGSSPTRDLLKATTLEVHELVWLDVNPRDGRAVAEIGLGYKRDGENRTPVTGGVITGNVFELTARVRMSKDRARSGWYEGPNAILLNDVAVD